MPPQNRDSQSSDERITRTPVLTASSSSFNDSPLVSPLSAHFSASDSPLPKQPSEAHVYFEEHPEAWWGRRASVESSSSTHPLELRPYGLLKLRTPRDILGAAYRAPDLQPEYANPHSEGLSQSVDQENKQSISSLPSAQEAALDLPPAPTQATPTGPPTELSLPDNPAESSGPDSLCSAELLSPGVNVIPPSLEEMNRARRSSVPVFNRAALRQGPFAEHSRAGTGSSACLDDSSRPESSMLAHCDQHSLFPPSEALTQTQCGRLALQEAGVPHGSSKALAPSMPLENVSPKDARRQTSQFFQRLVRKTFARYQATPPQAPTTPHSPPRDAPSIRTRLPARPRTARYSMSFSSAQTEVPSPQKKDDLDPPKKSRWVIVQRFITRPGAAAKAASGANAPARPAHDRRLSSVSFLGDATTRVDPFARTGGLGATVSDSTALGQIGYSATRAPRRLSMATGVSAYTFERFSHVVSFPSGDGSAASREHTEDSVSEFQTPTTDRMDRGDFSVDIVDPDRSGTRYSEDFNVEPPDADPKYLSGRPATSRAERRYSSPLPVRPPSPK